MARPLCPFPSPGWLRSCAFPWLGRQVCAHVCMCLCACVCNTSLATESSSTRHSFAPLTQIGLYVIKINPAILAPHLPQSLRRAAPGMRTPTPASPRNTLRHPSPPISLPGGAGFCPAAGRAEPVSFPRLAPARGSPAVQLIYERRIFQAPFPFHCCFSCCARFRLPLNNSCHAASGEKGSE